MHSLARSRICLAYLLVIGISTLEYASLLGSGLLAERLPQQSSDRLRVYQQQGNNIHAFVSVPSWQEPRLGSMRETSGRERPSEGSTKTTV